VFFQCRWWRFGGCPGDGATNGIGTTRQWCVWCICLSRFA